MPTALQEEEEEEEAQCKRGTQDAPAVMKEAFGH